MNHYYVYFLANRSRTLYIGVTGNLAVRIAQHKSGDIEGFTKRYRIDKLVYFEKYTDVKAAIAREKQLKGWTRTKKIELIENVNPAWDDLGVE